jgi:carbonic anhydrase
MAKRHTYEDLIVNNRKWADHKCSVDPSFFLSLSKAQKPPFLYIGCSDSRIPLDTFTQSNPGEMFVHRNIANQVPMTDMNVLTVLEYAIDVLKVKHIIVCGHTDCGGVKAAYFNNAKGLTVNWVQPLKDIIRKNCESLRRLKSDKDKVNKIAELNVLKQVENLLRTSIVENAFKRGKRFYVHGWMLEIASGHIHELNLPVDDWKKRGLLPKDYKFRNIALKK